MKLTEGSKKMLNSTMLLLLESKLPKANARIDVVANNVTRNERKCPLADTTCRWCLNLVAGAGNSKCNVAED